VWGVLRFPRSVSNGAGARGASECRTCSHVQLQRAPATRAPQRSNICQNPSRTLALERKRRTVQYSKLFKLFEVGVPKLGNVPTQTVRLNRMHVPFDLLRGYLMF